MTFDQYMKRPVYVAQCRTWKRAAELNLCSLGIRAVKEYRDGYAQAARGMIALSIRMDRARGRLMKPNAKVSGGGTPSAALPGYAGDNNNNGET